MLLERAVEQEYRPLMCAELQRRVDAVAKTAQAVVPDCSCCGQVMVRKDTRLVSWLARFGKLHAPVSRFVCKACRVQCRPLLDQLGVEPGRISGSLARLLAVLAVVAPYPLAARLAWLLLGVSVNAMTVWRVAQRLGQAAADYSEGLSEYHADSRSPAMVNPDAPQSVVLSVDGCTLGMQVRISVRSRPAFYCCRRNVWKPPRDVIRWYDGFWSVVWEMPTPYSTDSTGNCGSWAGWEPTPQWSS